MADKTLNPVAWGYVEDALTEGERQAALGLAASFMGGRGLERRPPPDPDAVRLPPPRLQVPGPLAGFVSITQRERLLHARGRSFRDLAELRGDALQPAPDAVARPRDDAELAAVLEWAASTGAALIPFGGGSSVVGGVNPEGMDAFNGVITLSLRGMNRVLDVDPRSRTVHAQAGILGPDLDAALKPHGLAVRHFPQSYFHSTLGGWVATRGAGHFSTGITKIEDRVQALGVTLPDGRRVETRRLPASSIGPDPNRLWCGSEGALGIITDVHLRCVPLPEQRQGCGVRFRTFEAALEAARELLHAGVQPSQMRILDPYEHLLSSAFSGRAAQGALMILSFESGGLSIDTAFAAAQALVQKAGGEVLPPGKDTGVGDWRNTFFRQPYLRDALLDYAIISDTFETAVPWSAVPEFYQAVRQETLQAVQRVCGVGAVTCRSTHAYADGLCLYFGFFGPGKHGALIDQWWEIKRAAAEAVARLGGTQSHHHAMGRDHKQWATAELPVAFREAIAAAKRSLDPRGQLNPGLWFE